MITRKATRSVMVRDIQIGAGAPVAVQSMTKTDTTDVDATLRQIEQMVEAGCEIVRIAVPHDDAAAAMYEIRKRTDVPIVADIHFHYKLALKALDAGIDKLRINPGNIGHIDRVREVVRAAEAQKVPIRIGVNGGSLEKDLLKKYGTATPEAMVESGMRHIKILEDLGFGDIIISLKASDVNRMVTAYRLMSEKVDYPLHLGVTEAERRLAHVEEPLHLSIMGCAVNGPGEAHDSQLGITFGRNVGMIFKDGVPMRRVSGEDIVEEFVKEVEKLREDGFKAHSVSTEKPLVQIT